MRFAIWKGEASEAGRESGMAQSMTDGAGSKELDVEVGPASQDANDLFRTRGADTSKGTDVGVDVGVGAVDKMFISDPAYAVAISCHLLPSRG
jgi:hypothetical protein